MSTNGRLFNDRGLLAFIVSLSFLGYVSSDIYLPAFPDIKAQFVTNESLVALTFSLFLFGLSIGNPIFGYLSDRFGQRQVLSSGLILFIISSFVCAVSVSIHMLLVGRFLQAFSVSSAASIWQSIVVRKFEGEVRQKVLSLLYPLVAMSPVLAPLAGSIINEQYGWRILFVILMIFGVGLLVTSRLKLQEDAELAKPPAMVASFLKLLSNTHFTGTILLISFSAGAYFGFLTIIPFILEQLARPSWQIAYFLVPGPFIFMLGGFLSSRLRRFQNREILLAIVILNPLAAMLCLSTTYFDSLSIWPYLVSMHLMSLFNGIMYPLASTLAIGIFPNLAGSAAGLSAAMQSLIASIVSAAVAATTVFGQYGFGGVILGSFLIAIASWMIAFRHRASRLQFDQ